jgi:4-amino-4-deoxy-L-arabinose transferase-like glycosyltransferase
VTTILHPPQSCDGGRVTKDRRYGGRVRRFKLYLLPCLLLLCLTVPHLDQGDFRRDTGRYAAVGHYMWSGGHLDAPYLNPETPYFNKPPLALLIHGLFLKTFGVSLVVARIPSILAALGVLILSMTAARQIGSRAEAIASGFVLASTMEFFRRSREISLDFWQLFFMMTAVVLILRALRLDNQSSLPTREQAKACTTSRWLMAAAGIPLGLALLCKPLVALLVIPIATGWCLWAKEQRLIPWIFLATFPVAILVALPWHWHMYSLFGDRFLDQYFGREVVDRARGLLLRQPIYYYVIENLRTYWPWLPVLIFAVYHRFRQQVHRRLPHRDLVIFGLWWVFMMFVLLSIFPDKKPNYALPLFPMLSWIVAAGFCRLPWRKLRSWYELRLPWLAPATAVLFIALSIAPIQFQKGADKNWTTLLKWMSQNASAPGPIFEAGLDYNDVCYFYLKTGQWLRHWREEELATNVALRPILLAHSTYAPKLSRLPEFQPAFTAGNYVIFATSTSRQ